MNTPDKNGQSVVPRKTARFRDLTTQNTLGIPWTKNVALEVIRPIGYIIYDQLTMSVYISNGQQWQIAVSGGGITTLMPTAGSTGLSIVDNGIGPNLTVKGLLAGPGVTITDDSNDLTFEVAVTLDDAQPAGGSTYSIIGNGIGPNLTNKTITAGSNITIVDSGTDITISSSGGGGGGYVAGPGIDITGNVISADITLADAQATSPTTYSIVGNGVGPNLTNKTISAGSGIVITDSGTDLLITSTGGGGGYIAGTGINISGSTISSTITLTSTGAGTYSLLSSTVSPNFVTKTISAGSNITITDSGSNLTIASSGSGGSSTLSSLGGTSIVVSGSSPSFTIKGFDTGPGISLTTDSTTLTFTNSGVRSLTAGTGISLSASIGAVTVTNSSPATGVTLTSTGGLNTLVSDGTGPSLSVKSLGAGLGTTFTDTGSSITIGRATVGVSVQLSANTGTIAAGALISGTYATNFVTGTFSSGLYTIPSGYSGRWIISFAATNSTQDSFVAVKQNGSTNIMASNVQAATNANQSMGTRIYTLSAGNTIGMYNINGSSRTYLSALNGNTPVTWFSAFWLGP